MLKGLVQLFYVVVHNLIKCFFFLIQIITDFIRAGLFIRKMMSSIYVESSGSFQFCDPARND